MDTNFIENDFCRARIRYYVRCGYTGRSIIVADIGDDYNDGNNNEEDDVSYELMFRPSQFNEIVDDVLMFDEVLYDMLEKNILRVQKATEHIVETYCKSNWNCPGVIVGNVLIVLDKSKVAISSWIRPYTQIF